MAKQLTLAQILRRAQSPAGKLLIRSYHLFKVVPSVRLAQIMKDIDDYFGNVLTNPPQADEPANS